MDQALEKARELLETLTPLKRDCGRLCGARCCRSLEGEETGMLLFPGEEACYAGKPGWKLEQAESGTLVICPGKCDRNERPLSCRMFPLLPEKAADGSIRVRTDARARAVCPLAKQGISAMDPAFTEAVRAAGEALMASAGQAEMMERLRKEQEELRSIQREWRR